MQVSRFPKNYLTRNENSLDITGSWNFSFVKILTLRNNKGISFTLYEVDKY
jgi:hypothetical protein